MTVTTFNKRTIGTLVSGDPYLLKAKSICTDWLDGKEKFTLTTSGSTGTPKLITVNSRQLRASVSASSRALSLSRGTRAFVCLNIDYVGGFMMLIRAMELDWEVFLVKPSGNPLAKLPLHLSFDFTAMAPMQLWEILSDPATVGHTKKLGKILLGGVGLTLSQAESFRKLGQDVYLGYGMTETVSHVALQKLSPDQEKTDVYQVTGEVSYGTDQRGCLFFKGAVTDDRLVQTNDLAELFPEKGGFRLIGRIDNTVNSGGIKIQIEEMEAAIERLLRAEGIPNPFFLWKEPDERLGESLVLVVEGSPDLENRLSDLLHKGIARLKRPRKIYFTEQFSRTGSGKPDKYGTFEELTR